jgi:hypothetical protein
LVFRISAASLQIPSSRSRTALADENLRGELAAVLAGHGAFDAFDDRRNGAAVVLKLLGAVVDVDLRGPADVLVVGTFVGLLKASPPAYAVYEDGVALLPASA